MQCSLSLLPFPTFLFPISISSPIICLSSSHRCPLVCFLLPSPCFINPIMISLIFMTQSLFPFFLLPLLEFPFLSSHLLSCFLSFLLPVSFSSYLLPHSSFISFPFLVPSLCSSLNLSLLIHFPFLEVLSSSHLDFSILSMCLSLPILISPLLVSSPLLLPIMHLFRFVTSSAGMSQLHALCPCSDLYCNEPCPNIPSSLYSPPPAPPPPPPQPTPISCRYPSSPRLPPLLPEPLSGSLDSVSSHIKRAWRSPRGQDPGSATSARGGKRGCEGGGVDSGLRKGGGGGGCTSCYKQMSLGPEQQAGGGGRRGERDVARDPPLQPGPGRGKRGDEPEFLQTLHLCSPSPLLTLPPGSPPAPPAPPCDCTIS